MKTKRLVVLTLLLAGALLLTFLSAGGGQVISSLASDDAPDITNQQYAALKGAETLLLDMTNPETKLFLPLTVH